MSHKIMKKTLFYSILVLTTMQAGAASIDLNTAQTAARQFAMQLNAGNSMKSQAAGNNVVLIHTESSQQRNNQADYYIFNTDDRFIIIAGDDRANEVLAYGDSPLDMGNIPCGMQYWLDGYKQQMEYLLANPTITVQQTPKRAPDAQGESVQPLLTAMWDQSAPYYFQTPVSDGRHSLTGCAATSLSMVMYYWKYPTQPTPSVPAYVTSTLGMYLEALPPTTFDWNNMRDSYRGNYSNAQANAVAWLMRYVGQAEQMDYTPESSGTYGENILEAVRRFGYDSDAALIYKSRWSGYENYSDEEWANIIQNELYAGRPLVMCGYANGVGGLSGHAFNVDGYDAVLDMYHVNWGWGGSGNAHFALNAFRGSNMTFNKIQQLIVGMEPPATVPTIKPSSLRLSTHALVEHSANINFVVKGALLTDAVKLTLNDDTGMFTLIQDQVSVGEATNGKRISVVYSPSAPGTHTANITLTSNGAKDVTIALKSTAALETYDPVMLDASDVDASSFVAHWNDATPAQNVSCYNLESARVPYSEICLQENFNNLSAATSDCSSRLDEITSNPGWTGSRVFQGDRYLRIGNNKAKGWLETPCLDMRDSNGKLTVKVRAKCVSTDESALLNISCGDNDTTIMITADEADYCVLLPCPANQSVKMRLANSITTRRVLITGVDVLVGDDYSPIDVSSIINHEGISGQSYLFRGLIPGSYAVRVQARYSDGSLSAWSNRVRVMINGKRGDVNHDGEINLSDANAVIDVVINNNVSKLTFNASDVNGDGEVNLIDLNTLIELILNGN